MIKKIVGIYKLLRSVSYILITDKVSIISLPKITNPYTFDDKMLIATQQAAIVNTINKLEETLKKHEDATERLIRSEKKRGRPAK